MVEDLLKSEIEMEFLENEIVMEADQLSEYSSNIETKQLISGEQNDIENPKEPSGERCVCLYSPVYYWISTVQPGKHRTPICAKGESTRLFFGR